MPSQPRSSSATSPPPAIPYRDLGLRSRKAVGRLPTAAPASPGATPRRRRRGRVPDGHNGFHVFLGSGRPVTGHRPSSAPSPARVSRSARPPRARRAARPGRTERPARWRDAMSSAVRAAVVTRTPRITSTSSSAIWSDQTRSARGARRLCHSTSAGRAALTHSAPYQAAADWPATIPSRRVQSHAALARATAVSSAPAGT